MLRKNDIEKIEELSALRMRKPTKAMSNKERQQYSRVRSKTKETLQGLTKLLKIMPEDQLGQVFDAENMRGLFHVLLCLESDELKVLLRGLEEGLPEEKARQMHHQILYARNLREKHGSEYPKGIKRVKELFEVRRKRISRLWREILSSGALDHRYTTELVGEDVMEALKITSAHRALRALYYATIFNKE